MLLIPLEEPLIEPLVGVSELRYRITVSGSPEFCNYILRPRFKVDVLKLCALIGDTSHKNPGPSVSEIRGGKLYAPDPYCWNDLNHSLSYRRYTPWSSALNGDCTGICDMNRSDVPLV